MFIQALILAWTRLTLVILPVCPAYWEPRRGPRTSCCCLRRKPKWKQRLTWNTKTVSWQRPGTLCVTVDVASRFDGLKYALNPMTCRGRLLWLQTTVAVHVYGLISHSFEGLYTGRWSCQKFWFNQSGRGYLVIQPVGDITVATFISYTQYMTKGCFLVVDRVLTKLTWASQCTPWWPQWLGVLPSAATSRLRPSASSCCPGCRCGSGCRRCADAAGRRFRAARSPEGRRGGRRPSAPPPAGQHRYHRAMGCFFFLLNA